MLCQLSYAPKGDGTRTRNRSSKKEPPLTQQADFDFQNAPTAEASCGCEARARTWSSCFRGRRGAGSTTSHGSSVWTGRLELPTSGFRRRRASIALRPVGTDGGSRTRTDGGLSAVPLPVGLRQQVVARTGIEPACKAYETSLITRSLAV